MMTWLLTKRRDVAGTTPQSVFFDGEDSVSWMDTDSIYGIRNLADVWSSTYITFNLISAATPTISRSLRRE
ncbi:hypothetical protein GYMLUDRAFT_911136 [Collybiopsis luxurians FD-317 M1]|nr:hypothetical protein GYMLUDRAFT_911136 [Collybiopsis luxurians FD-317 M1]